MAKNEIRFADHNTIAPGELDPRNAKVSISIRVDGDVLLEYKRRAKLTGVPYQKLMNQALRGALASASTAIPEGAQLTLQEIKLIKRGLRNSGFIEKLVEIAVAQPVTEQASRPRKKQKALAE